jgi:hypothetical protein
MVSESEMKAAGAESGAGRMSLVLARDVVYDERTTFPTHHHDYSSLFVVVSGSVRDRSGPLSAECGPGSVGFIPAGVEHSSSFGPGRSLGVTIVIPDFWLEKACESAALWQSAGYAQGPGVAAHAFRLSSLVQHARSHHRG